jgi:hypothetical protein
MNIDTISILAGAVITVASVMLGIRWQLAKKKLTEIRQLIDTVDDALNDDKVSEEEFRKIFQNLTAVVKS